MRKCVLYRFLIQGIYTHVRTYLGLFCCAFIITGCAAPQKIPTKTLCRGTQRPYKVQGIHYTPQDHYGYDETGIASWYGPGFHQRPTSCGAIYDMFALTAAHKTLPIPSVVEVTNLENGKSLRVVINDRGPFVKNRIIDLSKRAAQELGVHAKGLSRVRVRALPADSAALASYLNQFGRYGKDPRGRSWDHIYFKEVAGRSYRPPAPSVRAQSTQKTVYRKTPQAPLPLDYTALTRLIDQTHAPQHKVSATPISSRRSPLNKTYFIQLGQYLQRKNAAQALRRLNSFSNAHIARTPGASGLYRVQAGPYTSHTQASRALKILKKQGYAGKIITHG